MNRNITWVPELRGEKLGPHQWQSKARYQAKCVKDIDSQVMVANAKRKGKGKPLPRLAVNHHKAATMKGEWSLKWQEMGNEAFRFSLVCPRKQLPWPADVTVPVHLVGGSPRRRQVAPLQPRLQLLPLLWLHVHLTFNCCTPGRGNSSPPVRSDPKS